MSSTALRQNTPAASVFGADFLRSLESRIEREINKLMRTATQAGLVEVTRGGDEADLTASRLEHAREMAARARCVDGLAEWTDALDRLRNHPETFGRCTRCHQPIHRDRLEILPTACTCVACQ